MTYSLLYDIVALYVMKKYGNKYIMVESGDNLYFCAMYKGNKNVYSSPLHKLANVLINGLAKFIMAMVYKRGQRNSINKIKE